MDADPGPINVAVPRWSALGDSFSENYGTLRKLTKVDSKVELNNSSKNRNELVYRNGSVQFARSECTNGPKQPIYAVPHVDLSEEPEGINYVTARYIEDINRNIAEIDKSYEDMRLANYRNGTLDTNKKVDMIPMPPIDLDFEPEQDETVVLRRLNFGRAPPPPQRSSSLEDAKRLSAGSVSVTSISTQSTDSVESSRRKCRARCHRKSELPSSSTDEEDRRSSLSGLSRSFNRTKKNPLRHSERNLRRSTELNEPCRVRKYDTLPRSLVRRNSKPKQVKDFVLDATEIIRRGEIERNSRRNRCPSHPKVAATLPRRNAKEPLRRFSGNVPALEPLYEHAVSNPVKPRDTTKVIPWYELATRKYRHRSCPSLQVLFCPCQFLLLMLAANGLFNLIRQLEENSSNETFS